MWSSIDWKYLFYYLNACECETNVYFYFGSSFVIVCNNNFKFSARITSYTVRHMVTWLQKVRENNNISEIDSHVLINRFFVGKYHKPCSQNNKRDVNCAKYKLIRDSENGFSTSLKRPTKWIFKIFWIKKDTLVESSLYVHQKCKRIAD